MNGSNKLEEDMKKDWEKETEDEDTNQLGDDCPSLNSTA
jgi:hypothetical protein